jgi:hypothetical protein
MRAKIPVDLLKRLYCDFWRRQKHHEVERKTVRKSLIGKTELEIGQRIKMSAIGAARSPRLALKTGVVVGTSQYNSSITVRFDGNGTSTCLHRNYIEPI